MVYISCAHPVYFKLVSVTYVVVVQSGNEQAHPAHCLGSGQGLLTPTYHI
jgi:hypothetical protein